MPYKVIKILKSVPLYLVSWIFRCLYLVSYYMVSYSFHYVDILYWLRCLKCITLVIFPYRHILLIIVTFCAVAQKPTLLFIVTFYTKDHKSTISKNNVPFDCMVYLHSPSYHHSPAYGVDQTILFLEWARACAICLSIVSLTPHIILKIHLFHMLSVSLWHTSFIFFGYVTRSGNVWST